MADSAKIRLVRCPKCENLLPEPEDFSVYRCGGCGAVLHAKNREREADSVSDKSEEERAKGTSANSSNSIEKVAAGSLETISDSDVQTNSGSSRHQENGPIHALGAEIDPSLKMNVLDSGNDPNLGDEEYPKSQSGSQELDLDRSKKRTTKKTDSEGVRSSTSNYPDESTFNYHSDSPYESLKQLKDNSDEAMGQDHTDLLRKLDELKEQLVRASNVAEKSKEQAQNLSFVPGKHAAGPSCCHQYPEPSNPCANNRELPMHGAMYHPSSRKSACVPACGDAAIGLQMHRRALQLPHPYYSGQYVGTSHDLFEPYPNLSSCSCFHCYYRYGQASAPMVPPQRLVDAPYNPGFYPHDNMLGCGPHDYNPRTFIPPLAHGSQSHARWLSELSSRETGDLLWVRPSKVGGSPHMRPLAGGAPFLTCQNCFELLQLPEKEDGVLKKHHKLRCRACSFVTDLSTVDKKFVLSVNSEAKPASTRGETRVHKVTANFSSDYDNPGYVFHSMDREPAELSTGTALNSDKPQEIQNLHSSTPSVSEDELSSDSLTAKPLPPDSPLHEHINDPLISHTLQDRFGTGSQSAPSEQDKVTPKNSATRKNSMKDASVVATKMDVSFNDFSHTTGVSRDSTNCKRGDEPPKPKKGGFVDIVKRSFKDLTKSSHNEEHGKSNISVNGHPISERLVKKAEKQAGTIQQGSYWYDYQAGFWGVMGGPCLGIIPPFIEELNYPMPDKCAGGNTGVFVNGRELHQKDLDLLGTRGLPLDRGRSYIIDISGRVIDEDTGEELDSLGRLAPTIEKLMHGFGMKAPRVAV